MVLTFYLGVAALEFKQYAAYVQRRTATRAAEPKRATMAGAFSTLLRSEGRWADHLEAVKAFTTTSGFVGDDGFCRSSYMPTFTHTVFSR
jgi:hypothetical protein